ncbi:unnamed protein product [Spirodela intermedia]|uniref:Uncharacterized protein n=1 Tax=Spirodela intermedia TaxID=51605 RepID=A0A7I8JUB3_SPIIN|nr:unnamed protein product [Spirodela intermedia]CAA6673778.1 unnamed protein product [Spirodela intermedia]
MSTSARSRIPPAVAGRCRGGGRRWGLQHHLDDAGVVSPGVLRRGDRPGARPVRAVSHPGGLGDLQSFSGGGGGGGSSPSAAAAAAVGAAADGVREAVDPDLELVVLALHPPAISDEVRPELVLVRILAQVEVALGISGLDLVLPAEGDPDVGEARGLRHGLEGQEGATVVGDDGRMVFAVTSGGSFSGSAVETKMSIPGRSDLPPPPPLSNFSFSTARSVARLIGESLGSWSSSQQKANQTSQTTDIPHSQIASSFLCLILHAKNSPSAIIRRNTRTLPEMMNTRIYPPVRAEDGSGDLQLPGERPPRLGGELRRLPPSSRRSPWARRRCRSRRTCRTSSGTASSPSSTPLPAAVGAAAPPGPPPPPSSDSPFPDGVGEAVGADLEVACAREDLAAALVPQDLTVAASDGAGRAAAGAAGHLRVARRGVRHLIQDVRSGDAVEPSTAIEASTGTSQPAIGWLSGVGGMWTW